MLLEFSVEGYKPYKDRQNIELAPLTLIYGPNSGGKSSLIEAIQIFLAEMEDPEVVPGIGPIGSQWSIFNNSQRQVYECKFLGKLLTEKGVVKYQRTINHQDGASIYVGPSGEMEIRDSYSPGKSEIVNGLWEDAENKGEIHINRKSLKSFFDYSMPKIVHEVLVDLRHSDVDGRVSKTIEKLQSELELIKVNSESLYGIDIGGMSEQFQRYFDMATMLRAIFVQAKKNLTSDLSDDVPDDNSDDLPGDNEIEAQKTLKWQSRIFSGREQFDLGYVIASLYDMEFMNAVDYTNKDIVNIKEFSETYQALKVTQDGITDEMFKRVLPPLAREQIKLVADSLQNAIFGRSIESQDQFLCFGLLDNVHENRQKSLFEYDEKEKAQLLSLLLDKVDLSIATILNRMPIVPLYRNRLASVDEPILADGEKHENRIRQVGRGFHEVKLIVGQSVRPKPKSWYERNDFMAQYPLMSHGNMSNRYSMMLKRAVKSVSKDYRTLTKGQSNEIKHFNVNPANSQELGLGYQLEFKISDDSMPINIRHMGAGVSQVLPVFMELFEMRTLVRWNRRNAVGINVFQQPELHLHPRQQANLADIFINHCIDDISVIGSRQIICETHSELMAHRIQKRIRQGKIRPEDVCIIYVNPVSEGSEILRLELNSEGDFIDEWPSGFFDEAFEELFSDDSDQEDES